MDAAGAAANAVQPQQPPPQAPPPETPHHNSVLSDILHAVGDVLGGPKTRQQVNPQTGAVESVPLTREQRIAGTAGMYLRAAGAGLAQHGPGAIGKAALAGSEEEQSFEQQQKENVLAESKNIQSQILQKAQIAHQNNQQLLAQREFELHGQEFQQRVNDSNRQFAVMAQESGFQKPQIMVDGKDINGTAGNEAALMKYYSDSAAHKVPDGYSLMYVPTTDENGKMTHTVYQVPIDQMKKPVQVSADYFKQMTGLEPPTKGEVTTTMGGLIGLHSQFIESQLKQAQIKTQGTEQSKNVAEAGKANAETKLLSGVAAKNPDGSWNQASLPVMLVEGNADPSQIKNSRSGMSAQQIEQQASEYSLAKYGKPFDMAIAQQDYKYSNNTQTQNTLKMINGMTEPGGAIEIAKTAAAKLPQLNSQTINAVFNAAATSFGSAEASNFHTAMLGLADEYSKIMGGGVSSDTGRQQALDILKANYSKGQLAGAIDIMQRDIAARKQALIGTNRYLVKQFGQAAPQQQQPIFASAPGKPRLMSTDGGHTWQPAPAGQ